MIGIISVQAGSLIWLARLPPLRLQRLWLPNQSDGSLTVRSYCKLLHQSIPAISTNRSWFEFEREQLTARAAHAHSCYNSNKSKATAMQTLETLATAYIQGQAVEPTASETHTFEAWVNHRFDKVAFMTDFINEDTSPSRCWACLLYTSPSPRDRQKSRMPSSA